MIYAIRLLLNPVATWKTIAATRRSVAFILAVHVLPLLLLASAIEVAGLIHWGKLRGEFGRALPVPANIAIRYGIIKLGVQMVALFITTISISLIGKSFRTGQNFTQAFALVAFSLAPYFTSQFGHALPFLPSWIVWAGAVTLACAPLYQGVPTMLDPDPPQTFALYLMGIIAIVGITGLAQFLCGVILQRLMLTGV